MKNNKVMVVWPLIVVILLPALACGIANSTPTDEPGKEISVQATNPANKPKRTATPTDTPTPTPTDTPEPTATPTDTPEPTNTPKPTDTPTNTPEPTATPTDTPAPTDTPPPPPTPTGTPVPRPFFQPLPGQARVCFINATAGDEVTYVFGGEQITVVPGVPGFYDTMVGRNIAPGDHPLEIVTPGGSISSHFSVGPDQTWCEMFMGAMAEGGYVYPNFEHPYLRGDPPPCPPWCAE